MKQSSPFSFSLLYFAFFLTGIPNFGKAQDRIDFSIADNWCSKNEEKCMNSSTVYKLAEMHAKARGYESKSITVVMAADSLSRVLPANKSPDASKIMKLNEWSGSPDELVIPNGIRFRVLD